MSEEALEMEITTSSLAIVEKKPHRPGGCVGVFFQLFDWNRRFAKNKLFSKKLLSPGRLKQASKKFGGDEKQAKHRLIADENSGGFPNGKKGCLDLEQRRETRAPSLVAKLMGLESMPAALQREKSKKVQVSGVESNKAEMVEDEMGKVLSVGKGGIKNDSRPLKLQKTSCSERRAVTRFGADTLPFKNVLSRTKKHHPKLPVPVVKSPRNLSGKSSSKLIGAATKILEPGLQAGRSNRALTYLNTQHHTHTLKTLMDDSEHCESVIPSGQPSCGNCGHLLNDDDLGPKHCSNEHPLILSPSSNCVEFSCQGPGRSKPGQSRCYREFEKDLHEDDCPAVKPSFTDKFQPLDNLTPDVSSFTTRVQQNCSSQHLKPKKDLPPSLRSNQRMQNYNQIPQRVQNYNQMPRAKSNYPPRSKFVNPPSTIVDERKSFVSSNRNFASSTRSSSGNSRMENFEMEKRISSRQNDLASLGRKRRPVNVPRQSEGSVFMNSAVRKQTHGTIPQAASTKDSGYNVHSGQQSRRSGSSHVQHRAVGTCPENQDSISFTFSSQAKQKTGVHAFEKRRVRNDSGSRTTQKSAPNENVRAKFDKPASLSGDALGALLEQKLKELNSQGEDMGSHAPKKTTSMILQELISALTTEMPFVQNNSEFLSCEEISIRNESRMSNPKSYTNSKAKAMEAKQSVDQSLGCEHLSPGSVLEAFSSESCLSSSHDDNLGYKMSNESMDCCSSSELHSFNPDSELSDSANSMTMPKSSKELVVDILDFVSETLCCINLASYGVKGSRLDHVQEVLVDAELMFQNASRLNPAVKKESSIKHLLLAELETLATVLWMNFGPALGVENSEEMNQLTRFAFDSIIEYLDLRCDRYLKSGSKVSQKLPLCMSTNLLLFDIVEEVKRWKELSRFVQDELIDVDMSRSFGEWTEFEPERSETGIEVSQQLLNTLLDDIVLDLCHC